MLDSYVALAHIPSRHMEGREMTRRELGPRQTIADQRCAAWNKEIVKREIARLGKDKPKADEDAEQAQWDDGYLLSHPAR